MGRYIFPNDISGEVSFADSPQLDAFGRSRVATPQYLFDAQLTYDLQPLLYEAVTNGSGATVTHDSTNRCALMTFSSTPTGGKSYLQTYEWFRYQPGRSQDCFFTGNFIEHTANCLKFVEYGDGNNGVAFQSNGTGFQLTLYSDTAEGDQTVLQASWNKDKLDGTGASGITLNVAKGFIFFLDAQALYYGRVRCCMDIDGVQVCVHEFLNANNLAKPFIQNFSLPVRGGMTCTGTVSTTMNFTCCSISSNGGQEDIGGYHFSAEGTGTAGNSTAVHILSVRPKTTFNSITNRSKFVLESVQLLVTGNTSVKWELCLGQAISGTTTFNDVNATYSGMQYNTAGTISGSPSLVIDTYYTPATNQSAGIISTRVPMKYPIALDSAGAVRAMGTLSLIATGIGATSACQAAFNWKEIR